MNKNIFLKNKILYIAFLLLFTSSISLKAQESLSGLQVNPKIKHLYLNKEKLKTSKEKAVLELPFIDDFAKSIGFAESSLWEDEYVFVNQTYAYDQLTIGVATFDAIDGTGAIYSNASNSAFGADTLTSKPINLDYSGDNTIFLSFFYQPGGLGDTPDPKDSLILEFCHNDSVWENKWNVVFNEYDSVLTETHLYGDTTIKLIKGDTLTNLKFKFQQVIIPVNEDQYRTNNFQFRFRNYASLSTSTGSESKASNADHWHVDYIILDKDKTVNDTIFNDHAICKPTGSLLKTYEAMPWSHLGRGGSNEMEDSIEFTYRNLSNDLHDPDKTFEIEGIKGVTGLEIFEGGQISENEYMEAQKIKTEIYPYIFNFNPSFDSTVFEIRGFFDITDPLPEDIPYRWNDTTRFLQKFYNYYAYDDGTAENGYGIIGEGTGRANVAMQFNTYKEDTLRAVQFYFNQTLNDANQFTFKLHVWKETNGKPGDLIYTKEGLKPKNEDELNKFTTYILDSTIVLKNSFFIGWQKETNTSEMLNVGFDVNRINNDKLYYNVSGDWVQSQLEGTVMIRPLFGKEINVSTGTTLLPQNLSLEYTIYPNPAREILNINLNDPLIKDYRYTIFDIYGRVFLNDTSRETTIDISGLNAGIYFIRITNSKGTSTTKKFMVVR